MAIGATTVSFSDIRTEFGGTGAVSISDYYRGGTKIRSKAANNNGTNLASAVPTSGALDFSDYRSTAKGFKYTFTSGATDQNASDLFGDDYNVDYPKEIIVNSGVELGTTNTAEFGLEIDSGGSGTVKVTNNGTITGAGGAVASAGGDAVRVNLANVTIINTGTIRGGGGGGGAGGSGGSGGTGGGGSFTTTSYFYKCGSSYNCPSATPSGSCSGGCAECEATRFRCTSTSTTNTNGGSGGSGGTGGAGAVGQGYNQSAGTGASGSSGSGGSGGGTNAGTGGTGGTGGSGGNGGAFGSAGSNGSTGNTGGSGANGNRTNGVSGAGGSAGASGGAAGRAVQNDVSYTMTNTGTLTGAYN